MSPVSVDKVLMAHKAILEEIITRLVLLERQVAELDDALVFAGIPVESLPSDKAGGKTLSVASTAAEPARSPGSSVVGGAVRQLISDCQALKQLLLTRWR